MGMTSVIQFRHVWKTYEKQVGSEAYTALQDVSFVLNKGETLGLIGANGAGKSTSIKLLMNFIRPDQGTITLLEKSPDNNEVRRHIGYLPETANFPANLTVLDMLRYTGTTCNIAKQDLVLTSEKWLRHLGLWEVRRRPLRNFSKGMQQRANFAIALIQDPELLILDEPMSGLDPLGRADILSLIHDLQKIGKSILFCSHILEDVDQLVDNILILHKGKALFHGAPSILCEEQQQRSLVDAFLLIVRKEDGHA